MSPALLGRRRCRQEEPSGHWSRDACVNRAPTSLGSSHMYWRIHNLWASDISISHIASISGQTSSWFAGLRLTPMTRCIIGRFFLTSFQGTSTDICIHQPICDETRDTSNEAYTNIRRASAMYVPTTETRSPNRPRNRNRVRRTPFGHDYYVCDGQTVRIVLKKGCHEDGDHMKLSDYGANP